MEWTPIYIASQVFIILHYAFVASTYFFKKRITIVIIGFLMVLFAALSYICLGAWTALAMTGVAFIRNIGCLIQEKKGKTDKTTKNDVIFLVFLYMVIGTLTIVTYEGPLSLLSVLATSIYTYSIWQKKTIVYKAMGIPCSMSWILYNIYIQSLFGGILESVLLTATIIGFNIERKERKKLKESGV